MLQRKLLSYGMYCSKNDRHDIPNAQKKMQLYVLVHIYVYVYMYTSGE